MSYDAVVIGGGISGMTAAILLARHGSKVALLERSGQLAPMVRGFSRGGLQFDTGFHYAGGLGDGEILDRLFHHLGLADKIVKTEYAEDGFDLLRRPASAQDFAFPCGYARVQEQLQGSYPGEKEAIRGYLAAMRSECRKLPYLNLELPFDQQPLLGTQQGPSLQQFLDDLTQDQGLKQLLSLHTFLHGVPPEQIPLTLHACVVAPYLESTCGIQGGGRRLAQAYRERLTELGVEIHTGQQVKRIELDHGGKLSAVHTATGERFACSRCVSSVAPQTLLGLTPEGAFRPAFRKRLAQLEETPSAYLLFAACSDDSLLEKRNLFLAGEGPHPFAEINNTPLEQRTLYLAKAHPEADNPDPKGLVLICPADQRETAPWKESRRGQRPAGYTSFKQQTMDRLRHRVETLCPELGPLTPLDGATPLTLSDYAGNPGAGIYGVKHRIGQYNPQPQTRVEGLLLAGQGTAAPGILGSALSAYLCCGHLLGHDTLRNEVKRCS